MTAKAIVRRHKEKKYRIAVAYYLTYIIQKKKRFEKRQDVCHVQKTTKQATENV